MNAFDQLWGEVCRDLPSWAGRVLRPKHRLWTLRSDCVDDRTAAVLELGRLADRFRTAVTRLGMVPSLPADSLRQAPFGPAPDTVATFYQAEFHYLSSPRTDALHLGLGESPAPACLMSFSPFDLDHLEKLLPRGVRPEQVVVLSRQVTVGVVPINTFSYAFGRACRWLKERRPDVRMVLTYLDPNLGFLGASYRAANWEVLGSEPKGRYVFVDGVPVPNRELLARYGAARFDHLTALLGDRVQRTTVPLQPLSVLGFLLRRKDRGWHHTAPSHVASA